MIKCKVCGRNFKTQRGLSVHKNRKHRSLKCKNPVWLFKKYVEEGLSQRKIAELDGCSQAKVHSEMNRHGIKPRRYGKLKVRDGKTRRNLAYVLGAILSDGSSYHAKDGGYHNKLSVTDKEFADEFHSCISSIGLSPCRHIEVKSESYGKRCKKAPKKYYYVVEACSKELWECVRNLKNYSSDLLTTEEMKKAFIRGYFDGDGCFYGRGPVVTITSVDKDRAYFIRMLLHDVGYKANVFSDTRERPEWGIPKTTVYTVKIQRKEQVVDFLRNIGSSIPRKNGNPDAIRIINKHYEREELVKKLRELSEKLGHSPTVKEIDNDAEGYPCRRTYHDRFGSWKKAKKEILGSW